MVRFLGGRCARFTAGTEPFGNPLMGFAPRAECAELPEDVTLVYVDITWREWEPQPGVYDRAAVARENQLDRWRAAGKHVVLRFVCDQPGAAPHRDIPDWLYGQCGGQAYDMAYGKGCAPCYSDARMVAWHARAVRALGDWLGRDGFVRYVELGSLGHWGEWHVSRAAALEPLPDTPLREAYVKPWQQAFPQAKILMRRPFSIAAREGFGVYNDMTGDPQATETWLRWLAEGGEYDQTGEKDALTPLPQVWMTAPVGGELTSAAPAPQLLGDRLPQTLALLARSHVTFLGPKTALPEDGAAGRAAILGAMGYRLGITRAVLRPVRGGAELYLRWRNTGAAPLYWDWPVRVYVRELGGALAETAAVALRLTALGPGQTLATRTRLATAGLARCTVTVGILDPETGMPSVRLTTGRQDEKGCMVLFEGKNRHAG